MKRAKLLSTLIACTVAVIGATFVACNGGNIDTPPVEEGPETGVYYFDTGRDEYLLSMYDGNKATLVMGSILTSGEYTMTDNNIAYEFSSKDVGSLSATFDEANDVVTLTYNETAMRFLRRVEYEVKFDSNSGSAVQSIVVINGKTIEKPTDPTRDGYTFIGWYTDEKFMTPFMFGTQPVTADTVLYAQWGQKVFGQDEFSVKFDAGDHEGAVEIASKQTVGGKLYGLETPIREGYEFKGWWYSQTGKADELTARVTDNTVFKESTTLFAVWRESRSEGKKLQSPVVSVGSQTISWDSVVGANSYKVSIDGPRGFSPIEVTRSETSMSVKLDVTGKYTVTVQAISPSSADSNSEPSVWYYTHNALNRVSLFSVIESSKTLLFNSVENAERYAIDIDCGDKEHNHNPFDNGSSTNFNFSNCAMQEGGIKFIVKAYADGFVESTSEVFVYNKTLDAIGELKYNESTQTVSWNSVPDATNYIVSVKCGNGFHDHSAIDIGNKTSFDIKECTNPTDGKIVVNVYPRTKGYNSPLPTKLECVKSTPATPGNLRIVGNLLRWSAIEGDNVKYTVKVGSAEFADITTNEFDLSEMPDVVWSEGEDYTISVKATVGEYSSLYSDPIDARYYSLSTSLSYDCNTVYWRHVIGAESYEVRVNGSVNVTKVTDGSNFAKVVFDRSGLNRIEVRFIAEDKIGEWADITVRAYAVNFDARGGAVVTDGALTTQYYAVGDELFLPIGDDITKEGCDFDGWYNAPGGASGNGTRFEDTYFTNAGDMTLYANWKGKEYTVTLDFNGSGQESITVKVTYGKEFQFPVPEHPDPIYVFGGWNTTAAGDGIVLTDLYGYSNGGWGFADDRTVYVKWIAALEFEKVAGGGSYYYVVMANQSSIIFTMNSIRVPAEYKQAGDDRAYPVTMISAKKMFPNNKFINLEVFEIPATIDSIGPETFQYAPASLREVNVYAVDGINDPKFLSDDGILYYNNSTTSSVDLRYCPIGKTGDYTMLSGVSNIPTDAFKKSSLNSLTIPVSVSTIAYNAFQSSKIRRISFVSADNNDVTTKIYEGAFKGMAYLNTIDLPSHKIVFVDSSEEKIENVDFNVDVFYGCSALETINVAEGNVDYVSKNGFLCANDVDFTLLYCPKSLSGEFTVPVGIYAIGSRAFSGCTELTSVIIPHWVKEIRSNAFGGYYYKLSGSSANSTMVGCSNLKKVVFKGGRVGGLAIGDYAFSSADENYLNGACRNLTEIVFESGCNVQTIGKNAFRHCDGGSSSTSDAGLTSIVLPKTLREIGEGAFSYCTKLTTIAYEPDGVALALKSSVFSNCTSLTEVFFPANIVEIGSGVFNGCKNLKKVTVAENSAYFVTYDGVLFGNAKDEYGQPIRDTEKNEDGSVKLDENGNPIYVTQKNPDGSVKLDENGDPMYVYVVDTILYYPTGKVGDFIVPETVTKLGGGLFRNNLDITGIVIHKNVVYIGENAFEGCKNLKKIEIADGNLSLEIGDNAFQDCKALESIALPDRLAFIPERMFSGCDLLQTVKVKGNITKIGPYAFYQCKALTGLFIPKTVTEIGQAAFWGCSKLVNLNFEQGMILDEDGAIANPLYLTDINGSHDGDVLMYTFADCSMLSTVNLPERMINIGRNSFSGCGSLKSINIPSTVTFISYGAFGSNYSNATPSSNATKLTSVTFAEGGSRPLTISDGSYSDPSSGSGAEYYYGLFASMPLTEVVLPERLERIPDYCFYGCAELTDVTVPKSVQNGTWVSNSAQIIAIGKYAFGKCADLRNVVFTPGESGKLTLGHNAFKDCTSLTVLNLPSRIADSKDATGAKVSAFGQEVYAYNGKLNTSSNPGTAFNNCTSLAVINIDGECKDYMAYEGLIYRIVRNNDTGELEDVTLMLCPKAKSGTVIVSKDATNIAKNTFVGTFENITGIEFEQGGTKDLTIGNNPYKVNNDTITAGAVFGSGISVASIRFPARLTEICDKAFDGAVRITDISFDDGAKLTRIGQYAFNGCTNLRSVTLPSSLETIDNYAFFGDTALNNIEFLTGDQKVPQKDENGKVVENENGEVIYEIIRDSYALTHINDFAFSKTAFTEFTLPSTVTDLGQSVFANCNKLTRITLSAGLKSFDGAFLQCKAAIVLPPENPNYKSEDGVLLSSDGKTIVYFSPTLKNAAGQYVTEYRIPDGVTTIADGAFSGCKFLTKVTVPNTVTYIGNKAFKNCYDLEEVVFEPGNDTAGLKVGKTLKYYASSSSDSNAEADALVFGYCESLKKIAFPKRTESVGRFSFYKCDNLEEVTFAEGCKMATMESFMFIDCTKLKTVRLPDELVRLGCYYNYVTENGVYVPTTPKEDSTSYGSVFKNCTSLLSVTLPVTLKFINDNSFENCGITDIVIPKNVTVMGNNIFLNCGSLRTVTFAENSMLEYLYYNKTESNRPTGKSYTFKGCTALETVILPNTIKSINGGAFTGCTSLSSLKFWKGVGNNAQAVASWPTELTHIVESAFENCAAFQVELQLPSVKYVGKSAFKASGIKKISFAGDDNATVELIILAGSYSGPNTTRPYATSTGVFANCELLTEIDFGGRPLKINTGTTASYQNVLGVGTFFECRALTAVKNLSDALVTIDDYAFAFCSALKTLTVNNDESATGINIPASVLTIDVGAFSHTGIETVKFINATVAASDNKYFVYIYASGSYNATYGFCTGVFAGCPKLRYVDLTGRGVKSGTSNTATYKNVLGKYVFYGSGTDADIVDGKGFTVDLPDGLVKIDNYCFAYSGLTEITIPATVSSLGSNLTSGDRYAYSTFRGCPSLKTVTFLNDETTGYGAIQWIGNGYSGDNTYASYIFADCPMLSNVTLPNYPYIAGKQGLRVSDSTFANSGNGENNTEGLTVDFGDTLYAVGYGAFKNSGLKSITLPATVTSVQSRAFENCTRLTDATFLNNDEGKGALEWLGNGRSSNNEYDTRVFGDCVVLTSVTLPNSVHTIGDTAFEGATSLESIVIPDSVQYIGYGAFKDCTKLASITLPAIDAEKETGIKSYYSHAFENTAFAAIPANMTEIGSYAFANCGKFVDMVIPSYVTQIYDNAFNGCVNIRTVTFETSSAQSEADGEGGALGVTGIADHAFYGCNGLTSVTLPATLQNLGNNPFAACRALTDISIENGENADFKSIDGALYKVLSKNGDDYELALACYPAGKIGSFAVPFGVNSVLPSAFEGVLLTSVSFPEGVTEIASMLFASCSTLQSVTLPSTLVSIGEFAFADNVSLNNVVIPASVKTIGKNAFSGCNALTDLTFESGSVLESIGESAFRNSAITNFVLPSSVKSIGSYAFAECSNLSALALPDGLTTLGSYVFKDSAVSSINVPSSLTEYDLYTFVGGPSTPELTVVELKNATEVAKNAYKDKVINSKLIIPEGVTTIGEGAFRGTNIESVTLPSTLVSIGVGAFLDCENLTQITIPSSVTSIGIAAFAGCVNLKSVTFEQSEEVLTVGAGTVKYTENITDTNKLKLGAFANTGLTSVDMSDRNIATVSAYMFDSCGDLTTVEFSPNTAKLDTCSFMKTGLNGTLTIPNTVTSIGKAAFAGSKIVTLEIENGAEPLAITNGSKFDDVANAGAFGMIPSLTSVNFNGRKFADVIQSGTKYETLPAYIFAGNSSLSSVNGLSDTLKYVGMYAFYGCGFTTFAIPENWISIGTYCFAECSKLKTVTFPDSVENIEGITNNYISNYIFMNSGLESVAVPRGVTTLWMGAFKGCSHLTSVTLPDTVVTIREYVFTDCSALKSVVIPDSVEAMGYKTSSAINIVFENWNADQKIYVVGNVARPDTWVPGWSGGATVVWDYDPDSVAQ